MFEKVSVRANCTNDPLGNLLNTILPGLTLQFSYDSLNRLTNMVDAVGATRYTYNNAGFLLSEDGPWDFDTVTSTYNNRMRATLTLQQPSGSVGWQYGYDTANRLNTLVSPAGTFTYHYPAAGATLMAYKMVESL
jgi:YD repeat-containing protein